jgi:hypothetical protein
VYIYIFFLVQVDHLLTLLVMTLGLPVSKLSADEMALDLQMHEERTVAGKRKSARRKYNVI